MLERGEPGDHSIELCESANQRPAWPTQESCCGQDGLLAVGHDGGARCGCEPTKTPLGHVFCLTPSGIPSSLWPGWWREKRAWTGVERDR
jgi:hypothetical protein